MRKILSILFILILVYLLFCIGGSIISKKPLGETIVSYAEFIGLTFPIKLIKKILLSEGWIIIMAADGWQNSSVYLESGEIVSVLARGKWVSGYGVDWHGPEGGDYGNITSNPLVGWISENRPPRLDYDSYKKNIVQNIILIGDGATFKAMRSGYLYLAMGDWSGCHECRGKVRVKIGTDLDKFQAQKRNIPAISSSESLSIMAADGWQNSRVYLESGEIVSVLARGKWVSGYGVDWHGPEGGDYGNITSNPLVGWISENRPPRLDYDSYKKNIVQNIILIGDGAIFKAMRNGYLYLAMGDWSGCHECRGDILVTVSK